MDKRMMKCKECGSEFELRSDHRGKINICEECYLKWKEPPTVFLNENEYEQVEMD